MWNKFTLLVWACLLTCLTAYSQNDVFINEIHYDDSSPGDSNEGVELAGPAGTDLACYRLLIYNGFNGRVYDVLNLSGIIPNQCNGFGTRWFNVPGMQNGAPDGVALVFSPAFPGCTVTGTDSVLQFISYEGSFTATDSTAQGMTSVDIGVTESNSTNPNESLQLMGNGTTYTDFTWASAATMTHNNLNNNQTFNGVCGVIVGSELRFTEEPTGCYTPASNVNCEVCATDGFGNVDQTYTGTITLGVATGPGSIGGTVAVPIVNGCAAFNAFNLSASGAYTLAATDGAFNTTSRSVYISDQCTTCPFMSGAFIDACGADEGINEILYFNSGDFAIGANGNDIVVDYGATNPPATNYTSGFVSNQPFVDSLNNVAGCAPTLFVDAYTNQPIPPGTNIMMFRYNPVNVYDFSNLCTQGPIYVLFSSDASWNTTGNFKNCVDCGTTGSTPRYFRSNFTGLNGGAACDFTTEYTPCSDLVCNGNGDGLTFPYGGGLPSSRWSECVPSTPLPVVFANPLRGWYEGAGVQLAWATAEEGSSHYFAVERAVAGQGYFDEVGRVEAMGNSQGYHAYGFLDGGTAATGLPSGDLLYRLRQVDLNGMTAYTNTVRLAAEDRPAAVALQLLRGSQGVEVQVAGNGRATLRLLDLKGREMVLRELGEVNGTGRFRVDGLVLSGGVYLYEVRVGGDVLRGKAIY